MAKFDVQSILDQTDSADLVAASVERKDYDVHLRYVRRVFMEDTVSRLIVKSPDLDSSFRIHVLFVPKFHFCIREIL